MSVSETRLNHYPRQSPTITRIGMKKRFKGMPLLSCLFILTFSIASGQVRAADEDISGRQTHVLNSGNKILDARDVQILFVDLQPELIRSSRTVKPDALTANATVLAQVARLTHVPVTFSIVPVQGKPGRNIPALTPYASPDNTVQRVMAGTFMEPQLVNTLEAHKRNTLVIAGYSTEVAVLQTALGALEAGYTVYVATDAIGSQSKRTDDAALRQMEMAGAIPGSVLAIAAQLAPDFSQKPGSDVLLTFDSLSPP